MSQVGTPWHLQAIGLFAGASRSGSSAGRGITVAILDSDIDGTHPDLAGRIAEAHVLGVTGGLRGVAPGSDHDWHGHGTRVASLVCAAQPDIGTAPEAVLVSIAFPLGPIYYSSIERALRAIVTEFPDVAIVSLAAGVTLRAGDPRRVRVLRRLLQQLLKQQILAVVAVGNQRQPGEAPWSPADLPEALAVGATNRHGQVSGISRSGSCSAPSIPNYSKPDIVAPGEDVYTCTRGGGYGFANGTSFAAALVSGVAALYLALSPCNVTDLRAALLANSVPLLDLLERQGAGLVQVPRVPAPPQPTTGI